MLPKPLSLAPELPPAVPLLPSRESRDEVASDRSDRSDRDCTSEDPLPVDAVPVGRRKSTWCEIKGDCSTELFRQAAGLHA